MNFQAFRRTFATWMQRTGAGIRDVQGTMRHSSPDQTLKVYMREIPEGVRTAVDALDQMFTTHVQATKVSFRQACMAPPQAGLSECHIELEGPRGKMRIQWKGATAPDLAGLSRALWEPV